MTMRWYIVHAYSNFEKKVLESIKEQARQRGLEDKFEDILVPTEQVVEMRRGRKINSERKFFPGYVLVKCDLTDEVYHLIKNTPKVTGFLGADKKPMPISDLEADRIKGQVADGVERPKAAIRFEIGENVRVADGPFASFNGVVEEVDESRSRVKVAVSIFGRATPVDLEFGQVEKGFDWSAFEALLSPIHGSAMGAPGYPPLTMFKIVLLQQWHTLSDPAAEEAVRDRLSFRRFCGLPLDMETPDHASIWRFRQTIDKLGLSAGLLAEVNRQLDARGFVIKRGTLVDATLIAGAVRRP